MQSVSMNRLYGKRYPQLLSESSIMQNKNSYQKLVHNFRTISAQIAKIYPTNDLILSKIYRNKLKAELFMDDKANYCNDYISQLIQKSIMCTRAPLNLSYLRPYLNEKFMSVKSEILSLQTESQYIIL